MTTVEVSPSGLDFGPVPLKKGHRRTLSERKEIVVRVATYHWGTRYGRPSRWTRRVERNIELGYRGERDSVKDGRQLKSSQGVQEYLWLSQSLGTTYNHRVPGRSVPIRSKVSRTNERPRPENFGPKYLPDT